MTDSPYIVKLEPDDFSTLIDMIDGTLQDTSKYRDIFKALQEATNPADVQDKDEVLYILTVEDLATVYEQVHGDDEAIEGELFWQLPLEKRRGLIESARRWLESYMGNASYSWDAVLMDSLRDARDEGEETEDELV